MQLPSLVLEHRAAIAALCQHAHARRLELFGSAVRDDFDAVSSDLDFLVEFDELPPTQYSEAFFGLKQGLEQLFARPVDLVVERAIRNPFFKQRVNAERQTVYVG